MLGRFINKESFLKDSGLSVRVLLMEGKTTQELFLMDCEAEGLTPEGFKLRRVSTWFVTEQANNPGYYKETYAQDPSGQLITAGRFVRK